MNTSTMPLENRMIEHEKEIIEILSKISYFIPPEVVNFVQQKNKDQKDYFSRLFHLYIEDTTKADEIMDTYLFDGSDCIFPGVRRYCGNERTLPKRQYDKTFNAIIDDNEFPRHIWTFLYSGIPYRSESWENFKGFELAHIFSHKRGNQQTENECLRSAVNTTAPDYLFTSASNTSLIPKGMAKPTDTLSLCKKVFFTRHQELFGDTIFNQKAFKTPNGIEKEWYNKLIWNNPSDSLKGINWQENIEQLCDYRKKRIETIMRNTRAK